MAFWALCNSVHSPNSLKTLLEQSRRAWWAVQLLSACPFYLGEQERGSGWLSLHFGLDLYALAGSRWSTLFFPLY